MNRSAIAAVAFMLLAGSAEAGAQPIIQGPGGAQATCGSLLSFGSQHVNYAPNSVVFGVKLSEWTPDTVEFLKGAVDACAQTRRIRQDYLDRTKSQIEEVAKVPERRRAADEKKMAEESKRQRLAECEATPEHTLYDAQERVIADLENIAGWKQNQAYERRVAQTSGVRNLWQERNNGEGIVRSNDDLKNDFAEYKRLGGKAPTPQKVTHQLPDPCAALR